MQSPSKAEVPLENKKKQLMIKSINELEADDIAASGETDVKQVEELKQK